MTADTVGSHGGKTLIRLVTEVGRRARLPTTALVSASFLDTTSGRCRRFASQGSGLFARGLSGDGTAAKRFSSFRSHGYSAFAASSTSSTLCAPSASVRCSALSVSSSGSQGDALRGSHLSKLVREISTGRVGRSIPRFVGAVDLRW